MFGQKILRQTTNTIINLDNEGTGMYVPYGYVRAVRVCTRRTGMYAPYGYVRAVYVQM